MSACQTLSSPPDERAAAAALVGSIEQLHSAPQVIQQVLRLTRDADYDVRELTKLIEKDPALAARLLRTVNSSHFGLRLKATGVRQAVMCLGRRSLRLIVLTFGLIESLSARAGRELLDRYWKRALTMAAIASRLAMRTEGVERDEAYTAALLADVGTLVLAQSRSQEYTQLAATLRHGMELLERERAGFGAGHPAVGAELLEHWEFPESLLDAIRFHHEPRDAGSALEQAVHAADLMADALLVTNSPSVEQAKALLENRFGIETDEFIELALFCQREIAENAELFDLSAQTIDCSQLVEEARRLHQQAALETSLELDSVVAAYEEMAG